MFTTGQNVTTSNTLAGYRVAKIVEVFAAESTMYTVLYQNGSTGLVLESELSA